MLKEHTVTTTCLRDGQRPWPYLLLISTVILPFVGCIPGSAVAAETGKSLVAAQGVNAPGVKISREQATQAALQALPGKVTDVTIERKLGKNVYVIEIVSEKDGEETDVLVDMNSGAVLGMDR
jgi:hypothetical protein